MRREELIDHLRRKYGCDIIDIMLPPGLSPLRVKFQTYEGNTDIPNKVKRQLLKISPNGERKIGFIGNPYDLMILRGNETVEKGFKRIVKVFEIKPEKLAVLELQEKPRFCFYNTNLLF